MKINYQLTPSDITSYQYAVRNRLQKTVKGDDGWLTQAGIGLAIAVVAAGVTVAVMEAIPSLTGRAFGLEEFLAGFLFGGLAILGLIWLNYFRQRKSIVKPGGPALSLHTLTVEPDGMRITGPNFETNYLWPIFEDISDLKTLIVLWIEPGQGFAIPRSAFANEAGAEAFVEDIRGHIAKARLSRNS